MADEDHIQWLRDEAERKRLRIQTHPPHKKPVPTEDDKKKEEVKDVEDETGYDDDPPDPDELLEEAESGADNQ